MNDRHLIIHRRIIDDAEIRLGIRQAPVQYSLPSSRRTSVSEKSERPAVVVPSSDSNPAQMVIKQRRRRSMLGRLAHKVHGIVLDTWHRARRLAPASSHNSRGIDDASV